MWRNRDGPKPRPRNPTNVSSNAMYPTFNMNQTEMHWNKRNLKLRNWHKLLLPCRRTCLHVSMKFTARSISFDLWIKKSALWIVQMDIFGYFVRETNPPITLAGRGLNTIALAAACFNFSLPSLGMYTSVQICTNINAPDDECCTAVGRSWSHYLTTLPVSRVSTASSIRIRNETKGRERKKNCSSIQSTLSTEGIVTHFILIYADIMNGCHLVECNSVRP
jgi:hypothetical protein